MKISQTNENLQVNTPLASTGQETGEANSQQEIHTNSSQTDKLPATSNGSARGQNYLDWLNSKKPTIPKQLADPNSYDKEGNLNKEFLPLAIMYNLQVAAFNKSVDRVFRLAEVKLDRKGFNESMTNNRTRQSSQTQSQSHDAMMEVLAKLRQEMTYEWVWDIEKQESIRVLVPKRV